MDFSAILASGGVFAAISAIFQLLMNRRWTVKDRNNEIIKAVKSVDEKLDRHIATEEEVDAKQARVRIIRLADDIRRGQDVSDEYIANCMEDIDQYELFCEKHEGFKNSRAKISIQIVKDAYAHPKEDNIAS